VKALSKQQPLFPKLNFVRGHVEPVETCGLAHKYLRNQHFAPLLYNSAIKNQKRLLFYAFECSHPSAGN
jgi:hypothetical protein